LRWNAGDQITIFDSNTLNQQYQFDGETGDNGGTFSKVSNSFGTGNDLNCHYAVYPYNKDIKITETGVITATLPAEQSYAENSFGLGANTMVAVTKDVDDTFLKFRNVGGYLKLQLYGENVTVKSITLTGNNNEKLAGKAINKGDGDHIAQHTDNQRRDIRKVHANGNGHCQPQFYQRDHRNKENCQVFNHICSRQRYFYYDTINFPLLQ
jgi:hypothetical protein